MTLSPLLHIHRHGWMSLVWKNLIGPKLGPDLNPVEELWEELDWRLRAKPSHPTAVSDLTDALLDKWATTPTYTLQNLPESLPRTVEAVIAAEGETNSTLIPLDLDSCRCNV